MTRFFEVVVYLQFCWVFLRFVQNIWHGLAYSKKGGSNMSRSDKAATSSPPVSLLGEGPQEHVARKLWLLVGIMKYAKEIDEIDTGLFRYFLIFFVCWFWNGFCAFDPAILIPVRSKKNTSKFWTQTLPTFAFLRLHVGKFTCEMCSLCEKRFRKWHMLPKVKRFSQDMAKFLVPWMLVNNFCWCLDGNPKCNIRISDCKTIAKRSYGNLLE